MNLNRYDTIILDCDGVIFDSNSLKLEAFRDILDDYDETIVDDFIEYFKNNFGTSRYNLAKVFIEDFLKQEFDDNLYKEILEKYSQKCVLLYEKADITTSLMQFIEKYKAKKLFVASGSDQEQLRSVFQNRDLKKYFIDIFGSPIKKTEIVKDIVKENKNAIMIGDAKSDMIAAQESEIKFIFMSDYSVSEAMKKNKSLNSINNLGDLI